MYNSSFIYFDSNKRSGRLFQFYDSYSVEFAMYSSDSIFMEALAKEQTNERINKKVI